MLGWEIVKCLWCCLRDPPCSYELPEILSSLETRMKTLTAVYEDVMEKVELEEEHQRKRTHEVGDWIQRIEIMKKEVVDLMVDGETEMDNKCFGYRLPKNYLTICKLEKMTREKMDVVEKMKSEGSSFWELTRPMRPHAINKVTFREGRRL